MIKFLGYIQFKKQSNYRPAAAGQTLNSPRRNLPEVGKPRDSNHMSGLTTRRSGLNIFILKKELVSQRSISRKDFGIKLPTPQKNQRVFSVKISVKRIAYRRCEKKAFTHLFSLKSDISRIFCLYYFLTQKVTKKQGPRSFLPFLGRW